MVRQEIRKKVRLVYDKRGRVRSNSEGKVGYGKLR